MGLLLDLRHFTKHVRVMSTGGSGVAATYIAEHYAETYKKDSEKAEQLYESALRFGYVEIDATGGIKLNPREGVLLLKKKFGIPIGVVNAYFSQNSWVNLALGFAVGIVTTAGVIIAYLTLHKSK